MNIGIDNLSKYFKSDRFNGVIISLMNTIIMLFCSGYIGALLGGVKHSTLGVILTFIGLVFYIILEILRILKEKNFPLSVLDHLNAVEELKEVKEAYSRQLKVYEFIDDSIKSLNEETCPITDSSYEQLCSLELDKGLEGILRNLNNRTNYFLNVDTDKFTIGICLDFILKKVISLDEYEYGRHELILKDDFQLSKYLTAFKDEDNSIDQFGYAIHSTFRECIKFSKFICKDLVGENVTLKLICSPIPQVCEGGDLEARGLIYTFYEGSNPCPNDIEHILLIHGRLVANWLSKYEDCVKSRFKIQQENDANIQEPPEVTELRIRLNGQVKQ